MDKNDHVDKEREVIGVGGTVIVVGDVTAVIDLGNVVVVNSGRVVGGFKTSFTVL